MSRGAVAQSSAAALLAHFRLAFMLPLVIKHGFSREGSGHRVDQLCHIRLRVYACVLGRGGVLFHLKPILSIHASPRNLPVSSPIKSSPSRVTERLPLHHFM